MTKNKLSIAALVIGGALGCLTSKVFAAPPIACKPEILLSYLVLDYVSYIGRVNFTVIDGTCLDLDSVTDSQGNTKHPKVEAWSQFTKTWKDIPLFEVVTYTKTTPFYVKDEGNVLTKILACPDEDHPPFSYDGYANGLIKIRVTRPYLTKPNKRGVTAAQSATMNEIIAVNYQKCSVLWGIEGPQPQPPPPPPPPPPL